MPDSPKKRGPADRARIALSQPHERRFWCEKFRVDELHLALVIMGAGDRVNDVKNWIALARSNLANYRADDAVKLRAKRRTAAGRRKPRG